jgi:uncharacterized surface protein with fasciclin (FAS1) repeats
MEPPMAADPESPAPRDSRLPPAAGRVGAWLKQFHASNHAVLVRFWKYVFLISCVALTLIIVFDAYSFYVARRDIDTELRSKKEKVSSLEYLGVLLQRKRGLAITALEGRCEERFQLTLFRIFDAQHDQVKAAYNDMMAVKEKMLVLVKKSGALIDDAESAASFINVQRFSLEDLDKNIQPINVVTGNSSEYKAFKDELAKLRKQYRDKVLEYAPLLAQIEGLMAHEKLQAPNYWNMEAIQKLAQRNVQVRKELEETKTKLGDIEDVMARYGVWTGALTGGAADSPVLDETAYQIGKDDDTALKDQNCDRFRDYYKAVNNRSLENDPLRGKSWQELSWQQRLQAVPRYYGRFLLRYFNQPPAAQTLFVTMFLGALGALTLNLLRMSQVGWWSLQRDPPWGEIMVGPLLGALAAFGIFLVGSSGLLLTSDSSGSQPLSAYFIGLLGFISGLLYDEAFGRVRRIGTQLFAASPGEDAANARAEDRSLAETLQGRNASLAAGLVLQYGIGTRVSLESEFTLLIPSDEAMGRLPLATWNGLNDPQRDLFEKWYHHHHAAKRVTKADVAGDATTPAISALHVDDNASFAVAIEAGELKINDVRVLVADVIWNKGVVHILGAELP